MTHDLPTPKHSEHDIDRKYLDFKVVDFCLSDRVNIEAWATIRPSINFFENTNGKPKHYRIGKKIDNTGVLYKTTHQEMEEDDQPKKLFDWMEMNEEILRYPISLSSLESWFFSEFSLFYHAYITKPWFISIHSLVSDYNVSVSESEKFSEKSANEKKSNELDNPNQDEKELRIHEDVGSYEQELRIHEDVGPDEQELVIHEDVGSDEKELRIHENLESDEQELRIHEDIGSDQQELLSHENFESDEQELLSREDVGSYEQGLVSHENENFESDVQETSESVGLNRQKKIEEDSIGSDLTKLIKEKKRRRFYGKR